MNNDDTTSRQVLKPAEVAELLQREQSRNDRIDAAILKAECLMNERRRALEARVIDRTGWALVTCGF
jgi:hypothetical protein